MRSVISRLWQAKPTRDVLALATADVALKPIRIAKGLVVALYLGPADFGVLKAAELITMLDKFGNLGFPQVAIREAGHSAGASEAPERVRFVKNNAYSADLLMTGLLVLIGVVASTFAPDARAGAVVAIASVGLLAARVRALLSVEATIQRKFLLSAKNLFWSGLISALLVITTVPFAGLFASLTVPILVTAAASVIFFRALRFHFSFTLDPTEIKRQLRVGLPLTAGVLAFGSYRFAERLVILTFLGTTALGYYGFAGMVADQTSGFFFYPVRVRQVDLLEGLGARRFRQVHATVVRESTALVAGAIAVMVPIWFAADWVIAYLLPEFAGALTVTRILLLSIPIKVATSYVHVVVISPAVNKQGMLPFLHLLSTTFFVIAAFALHRSDILTLEGVVALDVAGYALYHLLLLAIYFTYFYRTAVKPAR